MEIKTILLGSKKFLLIPIELLIGLIFLPITISLILTWVSYKKIGNKKVKYSVASVFALLTLLFGSAYVSALVSPTLKSENTILQVEKTQIEVPTLTPEPQVATITDVAKNKDSIKVVRVIDGDTIEIENGQRVRYIGIDTPELSGSVECYGREAYQYNRNLVEGKLIRLEKDVSEVDRYGRLLRYVYLGDEFINEKLVMEGFANASTYPPDVKYQDKFKQAEQEARINNRGLWSSCDSITSTIKIEPSSSTLKSTVIVGSGDSKNTPGNWSCNCSKTCPNMSSCSEAQYQLNVCGCSARDADDDGIACDSQCQ